MDIDPGARECGWHSEQSESRLAYHMTDEGTEDHYSRPPSRHAPWGSDVERMMIASTVDLSRALSRSRTSRGNEYLSRHKNRSPTFFNPPASPDVSSAMISSPMRVGRCVEFQAFHSELYSCVASTDILFPCTTYMQPDRVPAEVLLIIGFTATLAPSHRQELAVAVAFRLRCRLHRCVTRTPSVDGMKTKETPRLWRWGKLR